MISNKTRAETRTLTVLARVADGRADELRAALQRLDMPDSPFATLPGVHFARLLILDSLVQQERPAALRPLAKVLDVLTHGIGGEQRPDPLPHPYLLFTATMDRLSPDHEDAYFAALRALGPQADLIWGHCVGYPGHRDQHGFVRYLRERSLASDFVFTAAVHGTVAEIQHALRLRRLVSGLAASTQDADDVELQRRFKQVFADQPALPPRSATRGRASRDQASRDRTAGRICAPVARKLHPHEIQGLVLDRYPTLHAATHLFLRVTDAPAARRWLSRAADRITAVRTTPGRPDRAFHLGLSHAGLAALGVPPGDLETLPEEFRQGMYRREQLLAPKQGTLTWREPFTHADAVHAVVLLSAPNADQLAGWVGELRQEFGNGFEVLAQQHGQRISAEAEHGTRRFMEHFGFVDGLSRPGVKGHDPGTTGQVLPAGEFVLGYRDVDGDVAGRGLPAYLARDGSFLVYRKLEQDVAAFRALTAQLAHRFGDAKTAAAKLVGRWPDGTPLARSPHRQRPELSADSAFDYAQDADGQRCPLGAHVRRANPRDTRPVWSKLSGRRQLRLTRRHQMLRRGIPYGPYLPPGVEDGGDQERGLLFLAIVGDIGRQFEFVQTEWMSDGNAFGLGREEDVFATAGGSARMTVPGQPPTFVPVTRPLVTCRGGEYFLLPSIEALRTLSRFG